jgi:hypothetical protein
VPYASALLLSRRLDRVAATGTAASAHEALAGVVAAALAWLAAEAAAGAAESELQPAREALVRALARHAAARDRFPDRPLPCGHEHVPCIVRSPEAARSAGLWPLSSPARGG